MEEMEEEEGSWNGVSEEALAADHVNNPNCAFLFVYCYTLYYLALLINGYVTMYYFNCFIL